LGEGSETGAMSPGLNEKSGTVVEENGQSLNEGGAGQSIRDYKDLSIASVVGRVLQ